MKLNFVVSPSIDFLVCLSIDAETWATTCAILQQLRERSLSSIMDTAEVVEFLFTQGKPVL